MFEFKDQGFENYIKRAAEYEAVSVEQLKTGIDSGEIVVVANKLRQEQITRPLAIGTGMSVKVNANLGTSADYNDFEEELVKMQTAIDFGADSIMDLSTGGDLNGIRAEILKRSTVAVGSVPIYNAAVTAIDEKGKSLLKMTATEMIDAVVKHVTDGIDYITVHSGITKSSLAALEKSNRQMGIVSRGGSIIAKWMKYNNKENPFHSEFDEILKISKEYNCTLSLGDGFRPGGIADATDRGQIAELIALGELVERSRDAGVQAMVEGPGHVPLHQVIQNMEIMKSVTKKAPFYILGPLVTDISPGYDHIAGAIGGALAGMHGADFLCYLTPAEHLALPDVDDVREGVIASKIAAHAADLARGSKRAMAKDIAMSEAKKNFEWDKVQELSLNPAKSKQYRDRRPPVEDEEKCTMCGKLCAMGEEDELKEMYK